jgi:uroporphyrinogen decarboxylase
MGIEVLMKPNFGPFTKSYSHDSRRRVIVPDVHETLGYVFDAIKLTKEMLDDEVPLIISWFTLDNYVLRGRRTRI